MVTGNRQGNFMWKTEFWKERRDRIHEIFKGLDGHLTETLRTFFKA